MTHRYGVIVQNWSRSEFDAYWEKNIAGKRPGYLEAANQMDAMRYSVNSKRSTNELAVSRPNKAQYESYVKQGLSQEEILRRYPNYSRKSFQEAIKKWGFE